MKISPQAQVALIVAAAVLLVLWYLKGQASDAAKALDPTSDQNAAYSGVNAVGETLTGDENFSFGVWLWETMNPEKVESGL